MKKLIIKLIGMFEKEEKISLLSLSMGQFTKESWVATIARQNRIFEYASSK